MEPSPLPPPPPLVPPSLVPPLPSPGADVFLPYHVPTPSRRPTSVLVLGILGIVLSALVLISAGIMVIALVALSRSPLGGAFLGGTPEGRFWQVVQMIANWAFYSVLLWASIAAIRLRPWARAGLVRWAWVYLAWLVIETAVAALWVLPVAGAAGTPAGATPVPVTPAERIVSYAVLAFSVVFNGAYPVLVLAFMGRRHVRAAFDEEAAGVAAAMPPMAALAPPAAAGPLAAPGGGPG